MDATTLAERIGKLAETLDTVIDNEVDPTTKDNTLRAVRNDLWKEMLELEQEEQTYADLSWTVEDVQIEADQEQPRPSGSTSTRGPFFCLRQGG